MKNEKNKKALIYLKLSNMRKGMKTFFEKIRRSSQKREFRLVE